MPLPRLLRSSGFRLTALTAALFGAGALIYGSVVYYGVRASMEEQLRERILAETAYLYGDYQDNGIEELRHDIGERLERAPSPRLFYTLANAQGVRVFDRLELPAPAGWHHIESTGGPEVILLVTELRDGFRLGVAAEARSLEEFGHALRRTTLLQVLALTLIGLGVGVLLSRRFLTRIEHLRRTAEAVGKGQLSERIPLSGRNDDFEQVAVEINRMLGRIEGLVAESRRVSSDIAHDLRTPLGVVRQKLESLIGQTQEPSTRQLCEDAMRALDGALDTFAGLLRIAELESGRSPLQPKAFNLSELMTGLHETFEPVAASRGQSLYLDLGNDVPLCADRALVTQLIVNLVENAIRHNASGVRIGLRAQRQAEGTRVEVVDDGVGIPEAAIDEVTKPFFRMDRSRRTPGSGLGLCLASRIAERHGARLNLADAHPGLRASVLFPDSPPSSTERSPTPAAR